MATEIRMPQMGVSMETGTISQWYKNVGDEIHAGENIASVETEKLTNDIPCEVDGVVLAIIAKEGDEVPIQGLMAVVGAPGEVWSSGEAPSAPVQPTAQETPQSADLQTAAPAAAQRTKASPLARKVAAKLGVSLADMQPTGTSGRIKSKDVYAFAEQAKAAAPAAPAAASVAAPAPAALELMEGDTVVKLSGMRKVVAERMLQSHTQIPPVTQNIKVDVTELMLLRKMLLEKTGKKYSVNDLILQATAKCLRQHPEMLVSFDAASHQIIQRAHVNLGMAVALDGGLLTPVIRDADLLGLDRLANAAKDLATRAKENRLTADEYKGSTFTVTNLGMFGIETFTPIINQPDSAILGVCAIEDELAMDDDGNVTKRQVMRLSVTLDHRSLDGAVVAKFEKDLRDMLQSPLSIVL